MFALTGVGRLFCFADGAPAAFPTRGCWELGAGNREPGTALASCEHAVQVNVAAVDVQLLSGGVSGLGW